MPRRDNMIPPLKVKPGPKPGLTSKRRELALDLIATLREKGFDPAVEAILIQQEAMKQYKLRISAKRNGYGAQGYLKIAADQSLALMEYIYPKLSRSELTGAEGKDLFESMTSLFRDIANAKPALDPPTDVVATIEKETPNE